jgi:hypothetical protein
VHRAGRVPYTQQQPATQLPATQFSAAGGGFTQDLAYGGLTQVRAAANPAIPIAWQEPTTGDFTPISDISPDRTARLEGRAARLLFWGHVWGFLSVRDFFSDSASGLGPKAPASWWSCGAYDALLHSPGPWRCVWHAE